MNLLLTLMEEEITWPVAFIVVGCALAIALMVWGTNR